ncbi:MAG: tetratricopeptide repeat protein [Rhodospirillales bacterium]
MKPKTEKDVAHLMERAAKAFRAGNLKRAESDANSVLKAVPNHPEALYCLGLVRHNQGRSAQAIEHLKRALAQYPDFAPCSVTLSKMLLETGDGPGAVQVMTDALAQAPGDANIAFELGRTQIITGNPQAGAEALGRAAELAPDAPPIFGSLGVAYQLMGDEESARAAYETAIELGSRDPEDFYNLGTVHMNGRRWTDAIDMFTRATELNPQHQSAFANIGLLHGRATEYDRAIAPLEQAVALNPEDARSVNELVYALSVQGRADEAVSLAEAFLSRHPEAKHLYDQMSFAWMRAGRPENAIAVADKAIAAGNHPVPALAMKSAALNNLGRGTDAGRLLDFSRLLKTKVHDAPVGYHSMASFNQDLVRYLLDHPSLTYSKTNRSMEKGRGTLELFDGTEHGPATVLKQMIMDMAREYMAEHPVDPDHPFLASPPKSFNVSCWGNVYDRDGRQFVHIHPTSWLSGVYYPALPSCVKDAAKGKTNNIEGWIEFGRSLHLVGDKNEPAVHLVRPEEGMMVMFPSYFGHQTIPVTSSDEQRVSIAFDLEPAES